MIRTSIVCNLKVIEKQWSSINSPYVKYRRTCFLYMLEKIFDSVLYFKFCYRNCNFMMPLKENDSTSVSGNLWKNSILFISSLIYYRRIYLNWWPWPALLFFRLFFPNMSESLHQMYEQMNSKRKRSTKIEFGF